jgi:hypothetical protein
MFNNLLI